MAETVRGGLYIGEDGRWHDAEGRALEDPNAVQGQVDAADDMDAVDGEAEPAAPAAAVGKKRGK